MQMFTDLVNWTPAVNGQIYTNSPDAGFFRIKLQTNASPRPFRKSKTSIKVSDPFLTGGLAVGTYRRRHQLAWNRPETVQTLLFPGFPAKIAIFSRFRQKFLRWRGVPVW